MISSPILQSIIQINADNIMRVQAHYQSYRDFSKHAFHAGKEDVHQKYLKLAKKELRKLHLLERNQRAMLAELRYVYDAEDYAWMMEWEDCYA